MNPSPRTSLGVENESEIAVLTRPAIFCLPVFVVVGAIDVEVPIQNLLRQNTILKLKWYY